MGSLTPVEELSRHINRRLPSARVSVDVPNVSTGYWYIDVAYGNQTAVVEWRPRQGFGVSLKPGGYGEGPEIIFPSALAAADYLATHIAQSGNVNVLLASVDAAWRGLLFQELAQHHLTADVVGEYADATRRLGERTYDVVIVDLPTHSVPDAYAKLHELLVRTSALVIAVGTTRIDDTSDDWFEVFVRKAMPLARIASIVESLTTVGASEVS